MAAAGSPVRLSVLLVTYNHEKHIRQALDSLLGQVWDGQIELVIADDASTDKTLSIIKEYECTDSRFEFKYLDQAANLGVTRNYQRGFSACSGEFVAVLEGDDYWVSPHKLSRQVQFLENHWECDLCSVNYFVFDEEQAQFNERTTIGQGHRLLTARDLIVDNLVGNFSTCLYRRSALDALPAELFELKSYDWIVNICIARSSMIGFLEEPMSVYRIHSLSTWSNYEHVDRLKIQLGLIPAYDKLTNQVFHAEFSRLEHDLRNLINLARVRHLAGGISRPALGAIARLVDFTPPILTAIARALLPPAFTRILVRAIRRSRSL